MKRQFTVISLILACLLIFSGCGGPENPSAMIKSAIGQKDFYFHDVLSLSLKDEIAAGSGSAAAAKTPQLMLCQDEYNQFCAELAKVKQIVYEGSVSADRKQIYVKKSVVNALGSTDIYTFTADNGKYVLTLNGKEVTADKDQLIVRFKFELLLLVACADTKPSDSTMAALGDAAKSLNVTQQGKDSYSFDNKGSNGAFIAAVAGILGDYCAKPENSKIVKDKLQCVIDQLKPCELRMLGIALNDLKCLKDKIGQPDCKDAITAFLLKVCTAFEVKITGNASKDDKNAVRINSNLTASSLINVIAASAAVVGDDGDALAHYAYKTHAVTLIVTNDLLLWPITADADVVASTITQTAANLTVTVIPDPTITERGIFYSTDSKLAGAKKAVAVKDSNGNYVVSLTGLSPDTTYYFKGYGLDKAGFTVYGGIKSFKTKAPAASSSSIPSSSGTTSSGISSATSSGAVVSTITSQITPTTSPVNPHTGGNAPVPFIVIPAGVVLLSTALFVIIRRRKIHS